ncbi:MAG TPA: sensor histidine kinase [Thermoanaerobaculia bacterium]|nr:sensor histidine kinase [Thermoanaerobaculia bacterium]
MNAARAIRITSLATWVVVGVTVLAKYANTRHLFSDSCVWVWALGFTTGVLASALVWKGSERRGAVVGLLLVATGSVLFVNRWWPSHLGGLPLVFIAWEAAQILRLGTVGVWVALQTAAFGLLMVPFPFNHPKYPIPLSIWLANTLALAGLQAFAVLVAHLMRRERASREELSRANAALLATRELALHGVRASERLRIARELHDVLGHHLSALSLNLEVAGLELQRGAAEIPEPLDKARALTRTMLAEVRDVVSRLRRDETIDLGLALRALVAPIPSPAIHLRLPDPLPPVEPERARTVLRCAQECVTNAVRHASAENLWIELETKGSGLALVVRDDGRGAAPLREGNGLSGMRERIAAFRGELSLHPGPPGFEAVIWVP